MLNSAPFSLDLPFRGARPYLHSASIANALAPRFADADFFDLNMRGWMTHRLVFRPLETGVVAAGSGHVIIAKGPQRLRFEITEDTNHPAIAREPYNEDAVPYILNTETRHLQVDAVTGYSFFDRLIAANKVLINRTLNPGVKLIAARILSPGFPVDEEPFALQVSGVVGSKLFRSAILIGGEKRGEVLFYGE